MTPAQILGGVLDELEEHRDSAEWAAEYGDSADAAVVGAVLSELIAILEKKIEALDNPSVAC